MLTCILIGILVGILVGVGTQKFFLGLAAVLVSDMLDDIKILLTNIYNKIPKK